MHYAPAPRINLSFQTAAYRTHNHPNTPPVRSA